ncbi:MAG: substrate-binding domain-containing protein, partial [Bacteroidota bacterium]|nr:substrate-binding domain-containing protein [Bacteroidota bacterium]
GRVDALVVMSPRVDSETLLANLPKSLPVVLLNCRTSNPHFDTIMTDGFGGAKEMTNYLSDQGHKRIAVITGGPNNIESQERLRGYRTAFTDRGLVPNKSLEFEGNFTEMSGYESVKEIFKLKNIPSAIFALNDSMAIGAIGAIREAGLRIPHDISICGFDDTPIAKYISPSLTSVHVPIPELGEMAIKRVFDRLQKRTKGAAAHLFVPTTLSIRSSCKKITKVSQSRKEENAA